MKRKKIASIIFYFLVFSFLLVFVWQIYIPKSFAKSQQVFYTVQKGQGSKSIAFDLQKEGIIKSSLFFRFYILAIGDYSKIKAGSYSISPSMSVYQIVKKFVSGDVVKKPATIIEGWNSKEIAEYLAVKNLCSQKEFLESIKKDFSGQFDFLKDKPQSQSLEGYIFPDTYQIYQGEKPDEFLKIALANFGKKLTPDLRNKIALQKKSIFEIITMASIIEKEAKTTEDKKIISGILWKRISNGMPLQTDSTINYITGRSNEVLLAKDTKINSLYNTYKYAGLPPGPISNPGIDSILAAVYPEKSDYWYYLSADGSGKIIFSKTLKEHNIAVAKYLGR